ncbi:SDR family oxidoreductase [Amycolatopsis sp. NBC_01480]|uniref:SDR family oxidoreductase n=1 Tax=Amycolatopsis sp. NBC_01480 TaxID=2903562 RepID=UPI002E2BADED|nr:SDR family NAD(P)-dependent oxidoreductase [Amycolatopsis sp. NBC_01480]
MRNLTYDFAGRSVLITGAARGVGLGIAELFARAGAHTFMVDFDTGLVAEEAARLGASGLAADVADTNAVENVVATVLDATGRLDVLVNNAGILRDRTVWHLTDEDWQAVLDVHLGGTFKFTRAVVPTFRTQGSGRIINVTSYTGIRGNPGQSNYAAAKAGIIGFTKTTAKELGRYGVTVNAISPNANTRMIESIPDDKRAELARAIPLGRFADPAEIADAVAFLSSAEARYITGAVLPVDGGISI